LSSFSFTSFSFTGKNKPLPEEYEEQVDAIVTDIPQLQALVEEWSK